MLVEDPPRLLFGARVVADALERAQASDGLARHLGKIVQQVERHPQAVAPEKTGVRARTWGRGVQRPASPEPIQAAHMAESAQRAFKRALVEILGTRTAQVGGAPRRGTRHGAADARGVPRRRSWEAPTGNMWRNAPYGAGVERLRHALHAPGSATLFEECRPPEAAAPRRRVSRLGDIGSLSREVLTGFLGRLWCGAALPDQAYCYAAG